MLPDTIVTVQVVWEKIPETAKGFIVGIVLMCFVLGILYGAGVDDPKVVYVP